jgi:cold shock CspA family protein
MNLLGLAYDDNNAPPPYVFHHKNRKKPSIVINEIHIDSSSDVFDSAKNYIGLIIYLCDGRRNFKLDNVNCQTGDIYIREADWIKENVLEENDSDNSYHNGLFYSIFNCWTEERFVCVAGGFAYQDGEWKFNSGTFNGKSLNNNDDGYHDEKRELSVFEKQLIQKVCNNLYTNHKWLEMSPEARVSIQELQKMNSPADFAKVHSGRKLHGTVIKINYRKGYGFIKCLGFDEDIFVHCSAVTNPPINGSFLSVGENVKFNVIKGDQGWKAENVTVIESD